MRGTSEHMRACVVKCGEFINNETLNQSLFVFLLLHVMEGAINFGTPCTSSWLSLRHDPSQQMTLASHSQSSTRAQSDTAPFRRRSPVLLVAVGAGEQVDSPLFI